MVEWTAGEESIAQRGIYGRKGSGHNNNNLCLLQTDRTQYVYKHSMNE